MVSFGRVLTCSTQNGVHLKNLVMYVTDYRRSKFLKCFEYRLE
jgi:hypothetical protein